MAQRGQSVTRHYERPGQASRRLASRSNEQMSILKTSASPVILYLESPGNGGKVLDLHAQKIRSAARLVLTLLAKKQFSTLSDLTAHGPDHLKAEDIQRTIESYPGTLRIPDENELILDVVEVENSIPRKFSVYAAVFTEEEGRSDLTARMMVTDNPGDGYEVAFYDVLVM